MQACVEEVHMNVVFGQHTDNIISIYAFMLQESYR